MSTITELVNNGLDKSDLIAKLEKREKEVVRKAIEKVLNEVRELIDFQLDDC